MLIKSEIKKWGNSLALRITGAMAEIPHFSNGSKVLVEVTAEGLLIKPESPPRRFSLPFTEAELLEDITARQAHADELAQLLPDELESK